MTGYTSGKTTHDPYPYVWDGHSPRNQMRADTDIYRKGAPVRFPGYTFRPRPEFDNHNPILVEFRKGFDADPQRDWVRIFLSTLPEWESGEVGHARRVLTRLAALRA